MSTTFREECLALVGAADRASSEAGVLAPALAQLLSLVRSRGETGIASAEVARALKLRPLQATRQLRLLRAQGWLEGSGTVYWPASMTGDVPAAWVEPPWASAARLPAGSYVGGQTAIAHWALAQVAPHQPLALGEYPEATRSTASMLEGFRLADRPTTDSHGIVVAHIVGVDVPMSDVPRTIADVLTEPWLAGGIHGVAAALAGYCSSPARDDDELLAHLDHGRNRTAYKRLGYLAERGGWLPSDLRDACRSRMGRGVTMLEPGGLRWGRVVWRWALRINADDTHLAIPLSSWLPGEPR